MVIRSSKLPLLQRCSLASAVGWRSVLKKQFCVNRAEAGSGGSVIIYCLLFLNNNVIRQQRLLVQPCIPVAASSVTKLAVWTAFDIQGISHELSVFWSSESKPETLSESETQTIVITYKSLWLSHNLWHWTYGSLSLANRVKMLLSSFAVTHSRFYKTFLKDNRLRPSQFITHHRLPLSLIKKMKTSSCLQLC